MGTGSKLCCRMITPVAGESGLYLLEAESPWGAVAAGHQEPSVRDKAWRISRAGSREGDAVGGVEGQRANLVMPQGALRWFIS